MLGRSGHLPRQPADFRFAGGYAWSGDYTGKRRRVTPALAVLLLAVTGCSTSHLAGASPDTAEQAAVTAQCTIFLVRHAEKQAIPGEKDPQLAAVGQHRAEALANRLAAAPIDRLFATGYQRTQLTLKPLAARLGRELQIYDARQSGAFLTGILATGCQGALIVAGHSNTLPELLRAAGIAETASEFDEGRYGELFIVDRQLRNGSWHSRLTVERFGD